MVYQEYSDSINLLLSVLCALRQDVSCHVTLAVCVYAYLAATPLSFNHQGAPYHHLSQRLFPRYFCGKLNQNIIQNEDEKVCGKWIE